MSESREIAHHGESYEVQTQRASNMIPVQDRLAMMREALTNPAVDPAKAREMFLLMKEVEIDAQREEFNKSKIAAMREMPAIFKRGLNSHLGTRYAKFEDMHRAAMPVLGRFGLTVDFIIGNEGRDVTVQPVVRHENGYVEKGGTMRSPPVEGKGLNIAQSQAIALAYLKRHSFKATFNLIEDEEDTDGSPPREGDQLNDRQERLLVDAQEQFEAGNYAEWYRSLSVKDRAMMVSMGHHARFGGGPALPGATSTQSADPKPAAKAARTPRQMVDDYLTKLRDDDQTGNREELAALQSGVARWMEGLKAKHPDLHAEVVKANSDRFAELSGAPASDDDGEPGGLFGGDE